MVVEAAVVAKVAMVVVVVDVGIALVVAVVCCSGSR